MQTIRLTNHPVRSPRRAVRASAHGLGIGLGTALAMLVAAGCASSDAAPKPTADAAAGVAAFATVQRVLQHPRCLNCHIPGDQPLQFDSGMPHAMNVVRGPDGNGAKGLPCASCHANANPPASYGPHAPPGAPHWALPPPDMKMAWLGLSPKQLCESVKDPERNKDRDFAALIKHVDEDALVLWGWTPGGNRAPVSVPHAEFVVAFKTWAAAGGPCPTG